MALLANLVSHGSAVRGLSGGPPAQTFRKPTDSSSLARFPRHLALECETTVELLFSCVPPS